MGGVWAGGEKIGAQFPLRARPLCFARPPTLPTPQLARLALHDTPPTRASSLASLASSSLSSPFDVLIIGGGATGTGVALDAATRGLSVALVERDDFAAGTSSRSTKLVHGGVRYLEKAFKNADVGQLKLVFEALHERRRLLANAPHLTSELPIMMPCYAWWEVPYFWAGLKAYDAVAGMSGLTLSRYVSPREAARRFPTLAASGPGGASLKGAIVYSDGAFDDARLALALALTAAAAGAAVSNYTEVARLLKDPAGRVTGAAVRDTLNGGREIEVHAKCVINAAGPFADGVRALADPSSKPMMTPSAGVHVTLPDYYSPESTGLIVPRTKDGRVVFLLPWRGGTIAGTTDEPSPALKLPSASEDEVAFILDAVKEYLTVDVRRSDVASAWSGVRPLAADPRATSTEAASRDHIVTVDPDTGLITVAGGKWTTYRLMAQDAVDAAVAAASLPAARGCSTAALPLIGSAGWSPALFTQVAQHYTVPHRPGAIDTRVAKHLAASYGGRATAVTRLAEAEALGRRLTRGHPELEAEVVYAARHELCETAVDFVARRTRLAFTDVAATEQALPRVIELLAKEKGWGPLRRRKEAARAAEFLASFKGGGTPPRELVARAAEEKK